MRLSDLERTASMDSMERNVHHYDSFKKLTRAGRLVLSKEEGHRKRSDILPSEVKATGRSVEIPVFAFTRLK
jgi:hypothetical protein